MKKLKKPILIFTGIILIIMVVAFSFLSSIATYMIPRIVSKQLGRRVTAEWIYVNPLTGIVNFSNLRILEQNSDSVFFSASGVNVNFSLLKLLSKTLEIKSLRINNPRATISQDQKKFNFNDLLEKFSQNDTAKKNDTANISSQHVNILNVNINNGVVYYHEQRIPINYSLKNINIESSGKTWDADTVNARFSFAAGIGSGDVNGNITLNLKNKKYRVALVAKKFDLNIIEQYLRELTNYRNFSANLDATLNSTGSLGSIEEVNSSGIIQINDLHIGKKPGDDYASFDKLVLGIKQLSPKDKKYYYDSIFLRHPYFKYERYDRLDNLQTMFGKNGSNITSAKADPAKFNLIFAITNYIKALSKNFLRSNFKIDRLGIYNGDIKFNDYSTTEKFSMELSPLNISADSIDKENNRVNISLKSNIKPYGNISAGLSINPKDSSDFDMHYQISKLPLPMFNPYIIALTSFPSDRGMIEFKGNWNVRNGRINSTNHFTVVDPRTSKRIRNKDNKWIPVPLIMTFVRERGNVIDYEIPITGNLNNPTFHLHDVIFDLLKNIFVKPPTTPYRLQVKNVETEIEKSITIKWETLQDELAPEQKKFIGKIGDFLRDNPEAVITVNPQEFAQKEKEYILFYEAKKKYFMAANNKNASSFTKQDSVTVAKMSIKDSLFAQYLNKHIKDSLIFTIQEKCTRIVDSGFVNLKLGQLIKKREEAFQKYFRQKGVDNRVKILKWKQVIPYNGFSFYKIEYNGEFPEFLLKAYRQMNELNNEVPRKKFKQERKLITKKSLE